jgi:membrane-bound metal-dependent hydrolase YbcI (DUF457 family)
MTGLAFDRKDKRLTHSVLGIVLLWAILATVLLVPVAILDRTAIDIPVVFLAGLMFGLVLHLFEDLCTRKGITPLFPFSTGKISGSIRPCDKSDMRIAQFHYYQCSVAIIVLGYQFLGTWQEFAVIPLSFFGLASCLGMMIWSSHAGIVTEDPRDETPAALPQVLLDPISFPGTPRYPLSGLMMGVYYYNQKE